MHQAFVLAAGFGTRLRPLTHQLPKPLVPVCGVPMLSYALALCAKHGLVDVVVNAHWMSDALAKWEGKHEGVNVTLSLELPEILGTGGGLKKVANDMADRFVVVNADVLSDVDLSALLNKVPHAGASMALRASGDEQYGVVAMDSTSTVVELVKVASAKPSGEVRRDTHFTGIHAMHRDALDRVPEGFACIVRTAYSELVPRREVAAMRHEGVWLDVGDPQAYLDTNMLVLDGEAALALDPMPRAAWARSGKRTVGDAAAVSGAMVRRSAWIGKGAQIRGATIDRSVVGEGAVVPEGTSLINSVVWAGCTVPPGVHNRVVIHPAGVLQLL